MLFRYRQIPRTSNLTRVDDIRRDANDPPPHLMCVNEWVAGFPATESPDDHRLPPSAREVLTGARGYLGSYEAAKAQIAKRGETAFVVWLVAPEDAGFFVFATLYVWRELIELGLLPRHWDAHGDWKSHHLERLSADTDELYRRARFEYLLASYEEAERTRAPIPCPLHLRLRSVFLAACRRRPDLLNDGAYDLFQAANDGIDRNLNPFYDSLFDDGEEFRPELRLLARDAAAYHRDIARAEKLSAAFPKQENKDEYRVFEVAWIEQPESLLFPDWAWQDRNSSEEHKGFAVARYSADHRAVYAIDPKISVAALEGMENPNAVDVSPLEDGLNECERLRGSPESWQRAASDLEDSRHGWWSLREPERAPGASPRVAPDDEKSVLERICEQGIFASDSMQVEETRGEQTTPAEPPVRLRSLPLHPPEPGAFRFASIKLRREMGDQIPKPAVRVIGETLWKAVRYDSRKGVPADFAKRHRQGSAGLLSVWTRYGLAVAYNPSVEGTATLVEELKSLLRRLAKTSAQFKNNLKQGDQPQAEPKPVLKWMRSLLSRLRSRLRREKVEGGARPPAPGLKEKSDLLRTYAELQFDMSQPGGRLMRLLFEETQQAEMHGVLQQTEALDSIRNVQKNVEVLEVFVLAFYTAEFAHVISDHMLGSWQFWLVALGFVISAIVLFYPVRRRFLEMKRADPDSFFALLSFLLVLIAIVVFAMVPFSRFDRAKGSSAETSTRPSANQTVPPGTESQQLIHSIQELERATGRLEKATESLQEAAESLKAGGQPRQETRAAPGKPKKP